MSHSLFRTHWDAGVHPRLHHMDRGTAYEAAKLGMWLFLATEVLLFGGLFAAYVIYHWMYPAEFHAASHHLDRTVGLINTIVLLTSSLTAALAVDAAQHNKNKKVSLYLALTIVGALIFLAIKSYEWHHKWTDGLFPGSVSPEGIAFNSPEFTHAYKMFYGLYYCMTVVCTGFTLFLVRPTLGGYSTIQVRTAGHRSTIPQWRLVPCTGTWSIDLDLLIPLLYLIG